MAKLSKQIVDQAAHLAIAIIILLPVALWPGILTYTFAGVCLGLIREVTEPGPVMSPGSLLDILFWTLGGLCVGLIVSAVN